MSLLGPVPVLRKKHDEGQKKIKRLKSALSQLPGGRAKK